MSYYRIDWDALNQLPDADKMKALADLFEQVRSEIGAERGRMVHQAHADHGTKKAAAAHLGMKPARYGQIYEEHKEKHMTTTTEYGTWNNHGDSSALTVEASVTNYISGGDSEWVERIQSDGSFDAMVDAYRDAINEALPDGVSLNGNDFYGPYYDADTDFEGYPTNEDGRLDIATIIKGVDLGEIVDKHDPDNA